MSNEQFPGDPDGRFTTTYPTPQVLEAAGAAQAAMPGMGSFCFQVESPLDTYQVMLKYQSMQTKQASKIFEALSSGVRLDLFRLLVKHAPDGLVQGDMAKMLGIPSTNLSFHLKAIVHSGLVNVEREGRFMRYKANIPLMLDIVGYLTSECCSGNPAQCQKFREASKLTPGLLPNRMEADS